MAKEMLINVSEGEECRIALVENGRLEELYMERTSSTSHVGNIYKGRVTNVEPSIQAAFVDFGLGRNGFLHISDLMPSYFGGNNEDVQESVGRKMARRDRPPIQKCLRRGDEIIVQIIKEGIGTKGPTLSSYLSIPGRILVMMPYMSKLGVSRKIENDEERRRLRQILDSLKPPRDCGFIIRTAGVDKTKVEIQKDLSFLTRLWQNIDKKIKSSAGPLELYTEGDLITRTVRDVFTPDIEALIVDNKDVAERVRDFIKIAMPRTRNRIELHEGPVPLFHKYGIEKEIEMMYSRHVPLPSGGSLVIDSTEAVVAIDVNSGKFRDHNDAEMTAFKTDMEAADEIPRQLRMRDLGGVIICDFIDLRYERHRRDLEKRLHDNLKNDRAKTKMLRMSEFGIIEMTRQRMRPSLKRSIYFDCPHCKGAGLVKTSESMALDVMRRLAIAAADLRVARIDLVVCQDVCFYLQNKKRAALAHLEETCKKKIVIRIDNALGMDAMVLELFDARDGLVFLEELGMSPTAGVAVAQPGARPPQNAGQQQQQQPRGGGRRDERRDQRGRGGDRNQRGGRGQHPDSEQSRQRPQDQQQFGQRSQADDMDDRFDLDSAEDAVEQRQVEIEDVSADAILPPPAPVDAGEPVDSLFPPPSNARLPAPKPVAPARTPAASAPSAAQPAADAAEGGPEAATSGRSRGRRGHRGGRGRGRGRGQRNEASMDTAAVAGVPSPAPRPPVAATFPVAPPVVAKVVAPLPRPPVVAAIPMAPPVVAKVVAAPPRPPMAAAIPVAPPVVAKIVAPSPAAKPAAAAEATAAEKPAPKTRARRASTTAKPRAPRGKKAVAAAAAAAAIQAPAAAVSTGSTDRHLVSDEPVLPPPLSHPRTYRDLDSIPDDFD